MNKQKILKDDFLILGFTGPFGSGCTTAAEFFQDELKDFKKNYIAQKDELNAKIANLYEEIYEEKKNGEEANIIKKRKELLKTLRKRQIVNALQNIGDINFYYISMTKMLNSLLIRNYINKPISLKRVPKDFRELIDFIQSWLTTNHLSKRDINLIYKWLTSKKTDRADKVFNYYDNLLVDFQEKLGEIYKKKSYEHFRLMQLIGNNLRLCGHPFYESRSNRLYLQILAEEAGYLLKFFRQYRKDYFPEDVRTYFLIECFRNPAEVLYFRKRFYEFYLFSVFVDEDKRHKRIEDNENWSLTRSDCEKIDIVDQGSSDLEDIYKQNIKNCVNLADIAVINNKKKTDFYNTLIFYYALIKNPGCVKPTHTEQYMHLAYSLSLKSTCICRQVGALIVKNGFIVGAGWNDPESDRIGCLYRLRRDVKEINDNKVFPISTDDEYELMKEIVTDKSLPIDQSFCYKDEYGKLRKRKVITSKNIDQSCYDLIEKNIETKSLQQCRALHAEENAILQSSGIGGPSLKGATLYTTTFPCELCAKKIKKVGIERIIFCEPYPKSVSKDVFLREGSRKIEIKPFSGVKSPSYYRLFKPYMDIKDLQNIQWDI